MKPGPVTIGDLRRNNQLLEVGCARCPRTIYLDAAQLPFDDTAAVPTLHTRMKCSVCGAKASYSRPDARIAGVAGEYPDFTR